MIGGLLFNPVLADDDEPSAALPSFSAERGENGNSELRRVQNRRATDAAASGPARRNLSADERRALHRELRDAMKGAYPDDRGARRKP